MTPRFILRPRAERDIQAIFEWYESQQPNLGEEFLASLRDQLEAIRSLPEAYPIFRAGLRGQARIIW